MKYLCLVYGEEKKIGAMTDDECMAYDPELRASGQCLASEAFQPVGTARTVQVRKGKVSVRDGPFTETKECLAGFYVIRSPEHGRRRPNRLTNCCPHRLAASKYVQSAN